MIDHVLSFWQQENEQIRYRAYITDALKIITENTAKFAGGNYLSERWIVNRNAVKEPQKSGDEIAKDIIKRANLKLTEGGR